MRRLIVFGALLSLLGCGKTSTDEKLRTLIDQGMADLAARTLIGAVHI